MDISVIAAIISLIFGTGGISGGYIAWRKFSLKQEKLQADIRILTTKTESELVLLATLFNVSVPFIVVLPLKVLSPPNVCVPAVTIPGFVASAG